MLVGFNYPWPANRYITIGPNLAPRGEPQPWTRDTKMLENFKILKNAGVTVVRMWLMGDGANYDGTVTFNIKKQSWDFEPPERVHHSFLDDFRALLTICESAGMQLIPVLVDFAFFDEPLGDSRGVRGKTNGNYSRGKRAIPSNPAYRRRFIEGTLEPLLKVAAEKKTVIYAFDVFNEPWWCIAPITGSLFGRSMDKDSLVAFLSDCTASVKKFGLKSTIGHRYLSDIINTFSAIKVDLPQHHYYASLVFDHLLPQPRSPSLIAPGTTYPRPAKILGEFASVTKIEYEQLKTQAKNEQDPKRKQLLEAELGRLEIQTNYWPELRGRDYDPKTVLEERLKYAEEVGYELALFWNEAVDPVKATVDQIKLAPGKLESVKRFTSKRSKMN